MQRINDERLVLKNLQNIRIAYAIQTLGILAVLGYDFVTKGFNGMTENPIWIIFIVSTMVLAFLSMNISVDHESDDKFPNKGLAISLTLLALICIAIIIFTAWSDDFAIIDGVLFGGILFICGMVPVFFLFGLRKKKRAEEEEE
nr:hypothetical protein [Oceanobacillus timonensis]